MKFAFTPDMATMLKEMGATCTSHPCTFEDVGDTESGPELTGGPAYDEWNLGEWGIYVVDGMVDGIEKIQQNPEEDIPF